MGDAIKEFKKRSGRTRFGHPVEQMVPFVKELPYDPSDMRILSGGPISRPSDRALLNAMSSVSRAVH